MSNEVYVRHPLDGVEMILKNRDRLTNSEVVDYEVWNEEQLTIKEFKKRAKTYSDGWIREENLEGVKSVFLIEAAPIGSDGNQMMPILFSAIPHSSDKWEVDASDLEID